MVRKQEKVIDILEQNSKNDDIIIHGINEKEYENADELVIQVASELGVKIDKTDISMCQRVGRLNTSKPRPRPLVAKFVRHNTKVQIMKNKTKLKGNHIYNRFFINEHLSSLRFKMLNILRKEEDVESVWSIEGKLYVKLKGSELKYTLQSPDDLFKLGWGEEKLRSTGLFLKID
jgi:hypothetical protein